MRIRAAIVVALLFATNATAYRVAPGAPGDADRTRREAIEAARSGIISAAIDPDCADDGSGTASQDLASVIGEMTSRRAMPYQLPCQGDSRSLADATRLVGGADVRASLFVDALAAGFSYADAACLAGAPAPVRIEHVRVPHRPTKTTRQLADLVAYPRPTRRRVADPEPALLAPLRSHGWILDPDAAALSREVESVLAKARRCTAPRPGEAAELVLQFTIGSDGRATELELGSNRREVRRLLGHVRRDLAIETSDGADSCLIGNVNARRFSPPARFDRVEITVAVIATRPRA